MKYFIIAGEASGDLHGSRLIAELKRRDPKAQFRFFGGNLMAQAVGAEPIVHYRNMAFMGFVNVLLNIGKIFHLQRLAEREVIAFFPDKVILIDYPGFNLRFAKFVKTYLPSVEVDYYIAPKLWAWKEYRLKAIKRYVDRMFTIFPFETEWFGLRGYEVEYVGNPSVDSVAAFMAKPFDEAQFRATNGLDERPVVALLAGSRRQEIRSCLPIMVQLVERYPDYQFVIAAAPGIEQEFYHSIIKQCINSQLSTFNFQLSNIAIDCWDGEPETNSELRQRALIATPHIAGYSADGKLNATQQVVQAVAIALNITPNTIEGLSEKKTTDKEGDELKDELLNNYNILADSDALKAEPEKFEHFRSNYPVRRELKIY